MTESAKKAIEEHARLDLTADHNRGPMYMASREEIRILGRIEAAEFGYHLGYEEAMKQPKYGILNGDNYTPYQLCPKCNGTKINPYGTHNTAFPVCDICNGAGIIAMAAGSKEPKP